jgi:hypothetical protein
MTTEACHFPSLWAVGWVGYVIMTNEPTGSDKKKLSDTIWVYSYSLGQINTYLRFPPGTVEVCNAILIIL